MEDKFIGTKFGNLEVVGWDGVSRNAVARVGGYGSKLYDVKCEVCAKDSELYGDGIFKAIKGNLESGAIPCGCSPNAKLSSQQYLIKAKRLATKNNSTILSIESGDRSTCKVEVVCNTHNLQFSRSVTSYLHNSQNCPVCAREAISRNQKVDDNYFLDIIHSKGQFKNGEIFCRSFTKGAVVYWCYRCPKCSLDEYTLAGVCSGVFHCSPYSLRDGVLPCRCNKKFIRNKEQQEYLIKKVLSEENSHPKLSFKRWETEYKNDKSMFVLSCEAHGDRLVSVAKFFQRNRRCATCTKGGFDRSKPTDVYVLLASRGVDCFTGYGISNEFKTRLTTHKRNLKIAGYSLEKSNKFRTSGEMALNIEGQLRDSFPCYSQEIEGFRRESTYASFYDEVEYFIKERVNNETN